jgi:hypothetical protein
LRAVRWHVALSSCAASRDHRCAIGDLDAFVAEIDFDAELATEGVDAAAEDVDLNVFDLTFSSS